MDLSYLSPLRFLMRNNEQGAFAAHCFLALWREQLHLKLHLSMLQLMSDITERESHGARSISFPHHISFLIDLQMT